MTNSPSGTATAVSGGSNATARSSTAQRVEQCRSPESAGAWYPRQNNLIHVGRAFNPMELFGRYSLLRRDCTIRVVEGPRLLQLECRSAWMVTVEPESGMRTEFVLDAATGVLMRMSSPDHDGVVSVTDLVEYDELPVSRFTWVDPAIESSELRTVWLAWGCLWPPAPEVKPGAVGSSSAPSTQRR